MFVEAGTLYVAMLSSLKASVFFMRWCRLYPEEKTHVSTCLSPADGDASFSFQENVISGQADIARKYGCYQSEHSQVCWI